MRVKRRVFWVGLIIVASASTVLFSTLWSSIFINPGSVLQIALGTGMPPSSIVDGHNWSFFQAYAWLSYSGRSYLRLDEYWKFLVPSIVGASTFMLVGLYMMKSGVEKEKEREARLLKRQESLNDQKLH